MTFTIDEFTVPERLDESAETYVAAIAVRNAVELDVLGTDALAMSAETILPYFGDNPHRTRRHLVARVDGRVVARGVVGWPTAPGATEARLNVEVLPEHRGRGIGSALLDRLEAIAAEQGRAVLQSDQMHTSAGERRLPSPTGFGDVPADDPGVRFFLAHGYTLEMVARISSLDPREVAGRAEARRQDAAVRAGDDYRLVAWAGRTPEAWLADVATLKTGMSTDAPTAGMETSVCPWSVDDVRDHGDRQAATGRTLLVAAAEHVPSGRLVAFTEIEVDAGPAPAAVQEDTLVLRDHRGHRLGMLVKAANLGQLLRTSPDARIVTTFNAEDNRPMLDVNEALGFEPIGLEGSWQKRVEARTE